MSTRTSPWPPGTPCWTDLTVPDRAAARAFYAAVLGWEFVETGEDFGGYVIAHVGDSPAAGIGPQQPGVSPAWTLYIASADADATAAAVVEHGGTVVLEPGDVGPLGRMLLAADAIGAVFGVWQASSHIGAGVVNEAGGRTWEDLRSTDPDAARSFYSNVFGYHHEPLPEAPPDYLTFAASPGKPPLGGIGGMMGADGAPSHWLVYFAVGDADSPWATPTRPWPLPWRTAARCSPRRSTPPSAGWRGSPTHRRVVLRRADRRRRRPRPQRLRRPARASPEARPPR